MKVIRSKTGCLCHNCDKRESEYTIKSERGHAFKVFWADGPEDCEISFCEDCAKELFKMLFCALTGMEQNGV